MGREENVSGRKVKTEERERERSREKCFKHRTYIEKGFITILFN